MSHVHACRGSVIRLVADAAPNADYKAVHGNILCDSEQLQVYPRLAHNPSRREITWKLSRRNPRSMAMLGRPGEAIGRQSQGSCLK
jgi:hypothetical protein